MRTEMATLRMNELELKEKNETLTEQKNQINLLKRHLRELSQRYNEIKLELQPKSHIKSEQDLKKNMQVILKSFYGRIYTIEAKPTDSILEFKNKITQQSSE